MAVADAVAGVRAPHLAQVRALRLAQLAALGGLAHDEVVPVARDLRVARVGIRALGEVELARDARFEQRAQRLERVVA